MPKIDNPTSAIESSINELYDAVADLRPGAASPAAAPPAPPVDPVAQFQKEAEWARNNLAHRYKQGDREIEFHEHELIAFTRHAQATAEELVAKARAEFDQAHAELEGVRRELVTTQEALRLAQAALEDSEAERLRLAAQVTATTQPVPVVQPVPVAQPVPVVEAQPAPVVEAQPAPVVEAQPAPVAEAQPTPAVEVVPAPVVEVVPAPVEAQPAPAVEVQPAPVVEAQPAPVDPELAAAEQDVERERHELAEAEDKLATAKRRRRPVTPE